MFAMEKAASLRWKEFWLERDSLMMVRAMNENFAVPWSLSTRWNNFKALVRNMSFIFTHIYREGNMDADALAKNGQALTNYGSQWWDEPPLFVLPLLQRKL